MSVDTPGDIDGGYAPLPTPTPPVTFEPVVEKKTPTSTYLAIAAVVLFLIAILAYLV